MYIDTVPNRESPPAILLRESYRESGKVKKRTLASLSKLPAELIARIAHQGSRLSATRWARDHAAKAVFGLAPFDEKDLYEALDWAAAQQEAIEQRLPEFAA